MSAGRPPRPASGFLSEEWFDILAGKLASAATARLGAGVPATRLRLGVRVTGVPWAAGGEFAYTIAMSDRAELVVGSDETADVVLVGPYVSLQGLAEGDQAVAELFEAGALRVRGDVASLLGAGDILSLLSAA